MYNDAIPNHSDTPLRRRLTRRSGLDRLDVTLPCVALHLRQQEPRDRTTESKQAALCEGALLVVAQAVHDGALR
ncbi:unnamed protein product [Lampetra planeri]